MSYPMFTEYSMSAEGVSTMTSEQYSSEELPQINPDMVPNILERLSLLKQIELAEQPSSCQNLITRMLRRTAIGQVIVWPEESEGLVRIDVSVFGKKGMTVDFEGENYRITKDTYSRAFDYVLKIFALTNCANASLIVEPIFYPAELETVSLPSRSRCNGLIPVKEVNWALGAPLELFIQLNPAKISVDTSLQNHIDGIAEVQQKIRDANISPV